MFYKPSSQSELSQTDMERVRKGFTGLLWKVLHNPEFIANNCDELIAIAHTEYVRAVDKGVEIEDPVAWTIHCAWRRTQNLLTQTSSRPREVSAEKVELVDETRPTPDQISEDADRARKIREAVSKLSTDQRLLVALMYLDDKNLAEAARDLGWHESKARRCHKAVLKHLHKTLGVQSSDELSLVGLAAWLSLSATGSLSLTGGFEAVLDKAGHEASGLWAKAHDLARRVGLSGGGDAASAAATSGAGRGVTACASIAVACVAGASGVVGPGVGGGIGLFSGHGHPARQAAQVQTASDSLGASPAPATAAAPVAPATGDGGASSSASTVSATQTREGATSSETSAAQTERQVREQVDAFSRAAEESGPSPSASAPSAGAAPTATTGETAGAVASGSYTSGSPSTHTAQAQQQFSPFK